MNFKIIVVEDEILILNNIVKKLNKLDLPLTVIGTATNGEDALDLVEKMHPHLLITDIRMPGMDGLTLCKTLNKKYPEIKLVILSGYNDFSYAQEAFHYHVSDYLLKPVNLTQLQTTMNNLCNRLKQEELAIQRRNLLLSVSGQTPDNSFPCSFGEKPLGVILICIGNLLNISPENVDLTFFNKLWEELDLESFLEKQLSPEDHFWILPEKRPNERFLITSLFNPALLSALSIYTREIFQDKMHVSFCTMPSGVAYQEIWKAAQKERFFLRANMLPCHSDIYTVQETEDDTPFPAEGLLQLIASNVQNHQQNVCHSTINTLFNTLFDTCCPQSLLENSMESILRIFYEQNKITNHFPFSQFRNSVLMEICMQNDYETLYHNLRLIMSDALLQAFSDTLSGDSLANSVKKYIDENYTTPLSMESLSEVFHFSDSYIGRIFRNKFDNPPMKYLLAIRIEEACRLIKNNNDLSIAAIGEMVGYHDQRYFSRVFRSVTGLTPSEYKVKNV